MSKHTPGPWRLTDCLDVDLTNEVGICYGANAQYVVASRNGLIGENDLRAMRNANARLIAAAPDLLEALQRLEEAADDSDGCQYGTLSTRFVRDIARAAIAKATGGTP